MHPTTDRPFTCVSCEGQIVGNAEFHVGLPFCCAGCVAGGPCICSYDRGSSLPPRPTLPWTAAGSPEVRVEVLV